MKHNVEYAISALEELKELSAFNRKKIIGEIEKQLMDQPDVQQRIGSV